MTTTRVLSFDGGSAASGVGREFAPYPDARFGVFLEAALAQAFLLELPVPAADEVRRRITPLAEDEAVVIAFLGTTPSQGYQARIVEVRTAPGSVEVVIAAHAPESEAGPVAYGYPVDARRLPHSALPAPPFDVVYRSVSGTVWFHQTGVRPIVATPPEVEREEDFGDTLAVSRELRREYREGVRAGRVIGREHATVSFTVFWVPIDRTQVQFAATLPLWLQHRGVIVPTCLLTDRTLDDLVAALPGDPFSIATIRGHTVRLGRWPPAEPVALEPTAVPEHAWLACFSGARRDDAPEHWLGTDIVDLYPVRLEERAPYSVEVLEVTPLLHDVLVRVRLHPPPSEDVPLDLVVLDPPRAGQEAGRARFVAAYAYYGFDRELSQLDYAIDLSGSSGRFFTWLRAPETHEFTLFLRLTTCTAARRLPEVSVWNPPAGVECSTMTAVQAFYTHRDFLRAVGLGDGPVELRCALRSPRGWQSRPFTVTLP